MQNKVQTNAVRVMVTTEDYEIEGYMHIKPGGYQSRISDLLNAKELNFIPITDARYRGLNHPQQPPQEAQTIIVKLDTIKMVVPLDNEVKPAAGAEAPAVVRFS